jgi:hypothetical protein
MDLTDIDDDTDDGGGKLPPIVIDDLLCPTEQHFVVMGHSMKALFVLALGQKNEARDALVDIDKPPWSLQKKKEVKPSVKEYVNEIKRRSAGDADPPKCNSWKAHRAFTWLTEHPITGDDDIAFIHRQLNKFVKLVELEAAEALTMKEGRWCGVVPYLRIIMCLIEDDIKPAFLERDKAFTRLEVDGRNSETRNSNVYEMISERWNCNTFNPKIPPNRVHPDYYEETDCGWSVVSHLTKATPLKVCDPASLVACLVLSHWFIAD